MPGATTLASSSLVQDLVKFYFGRLETVVAMICAGPLVALESGIWEDKKTWVQGKIRLTSHPSVKKKLEESEFLSS